MSNMEIEIDGQEFEVSYNVERVGYDECYPGERPGWYVVDLKVVKIIRREIKGGKTYDAVTAELDRRLNDDA